MLALGRNPDLAWGGTNLRAASSDLYDVSKLPPDEIETRETVIRSRFWRLDHAARSGAAPSGRSSPTPRWSSAAARGPIALRWVGQEPNDEMTCFMNCARAQTPEQFRQAFVGYGVSGQNMLFADTHGQHRPHPGGHPAGAAAVSQGRPGAGRERSRHALAGLQGRHGPAVRPQSEAGRASPRPTTGRPEPTCRSASPSARRTASAASTTCSSSARS